MQFFINKLFFLRIIRVMKFSFILMLATLVQVTASVYSQTGTITVNKQNATIADIFYAIEQQTEYKIFYKNDQLNVALTADVKSEKMTVRDALTQILHKSNSDYVMFDRLIVITSKEMQQGIAITGTVKDENGDPVPGANVMVKGTVVGIVTDIQGKYTIHVPDQNAVLVFSFVGYTSQEVAVGNRTIIDAFLEEDAQQIEEVVVIGYGTMQRRDLTGSVSSVSGNQLKDIPVTSASQAIVGRIPGVQVTKSEGSPDAEITIRVRGGGSITQDNSPLFIVDGFPMDNINHVMPTDIQSIDVLKDASSTAIYGARGANGVIIVTTKSGAEGKAKISYNTYYGRKHATKFLEMMDPYEYVYMQYELYNGSTTVANYFGDPRDFDIWKSFKGTDWQRDILGNTGTSASHNLSVSGGSKVARYNLSMTRNDENEIMLGSGYDQTNLSVKTSFDARPWLRIDFNTIYSAMNIKGAGTGNADRSGETLSRLPMILQYRPVDGLSNFVDADFADPDNFEISSKFTINPMDQTLDDYRRQARNILKIDGALEFKILPELKLRSEYGNTFENRDDNRVFGRRTSNVFDFGRVPMTDVRTEKIVRFRVANFLTYTKRNILPGHSMTVMAGQETTSRKSDVYSQVIKYFPEFIDPEGALSNAQLGKSPDLPNTKNNPADRLVSFFGRINYDYKGKYLLAGVFRADASSKFAPGNQWGYFPSASAAWRISDEDFAKPASAWLSNLKLRASYGQSGNNRINDDAWKKIFSSSGSSKWFSDGPLQMPTAYIQPSTILSNSKLKWETTITRNIGLDFGFFKQRLNGTFELYQNTTRDLLIQATIPVNTGYETQWQNIGQTSNRGIELTLEGTIIQRRDFFLSASFNIGFNRNRVDKLGDVDQMMRNSGWATSDGPGLDYLVKVGKPVGLMYGYETLGMYTFDDFDYHAATKTYVLKDGVPTNRSIIGSSKFKPGCLKLAYQEGIENAKTEASTDSNNPFKDNRSWPIVDANHKVVIGYAQPKHTGGFNIFGQVKEVDFSVFFNWVYGNNIYNANKLNFTSHQSMRYWKNMMTIMNSDQRFRYWDYETASEMVADSDLKDFNENATMWSPLHTTTVFHSWAAEDGSFLRLSNATIGYSIPKSLLTRFRIEKLRVYVTGYNLWIWTNYTGYDPEVNTRRGTPMTPGVDWCAYPRSRSYNVGLNLTF